ncbi:hypothetical protein C8J57DRAFT_1416937 [Mycena rebaudengoi]|nr:hypothetical protein C8J57DRAFT_1416937 [Mycena rebaudengoi]
MLSPKSSSAPATTERSAPENSFGVHYQLKCTACDTHNSACVPISWGTIACTHCKEKKFRCSHSARVLAAKTNILWIPPISLTMAPATGTTTRTQPKVSPSPAKRLPSDDTSSEDETDESYCASRTSETGSTSAAETHIEKARGELDLEALRREERAAQVLTEVDIQLTDIDANATASLLRETAEAYRDAE